MKIRVLCALLTLATAVCALSACGKAANTTVAESSSAVPSSAEYVSQDTTAEETAAPVSEADSTEETQTTEQSETTEKATEAEETTEKEDKAPETKEEILTLFNDAANRVKPESKSIVSNYTLNTQTSEAALSNKVLQNIANKLISANMGYDKKKAKATYASAEEKRENFPVRGQDWTSHLTAADVQKATCTEKDGVYTVTLYLVPDTTPNIKADQGHAGKAFSIITKQSIVDGAGSLGMSVIEEDSIKLTFKNCKITAKIDKQTGKMTDANYFQDWTLALTALGIDVSVSFGSEDDYSIRW